MIPSPEIRHQFKELENRIKVLTSLPIHALDRVKLQERLDAIGKSCVDDLP
ncbi:MAG: hypothetical protein ACREU6_12875 [Steroidobacteraceae bacterium]